MSDTPTVSFRDFAGAVMGGDFDKAGTVLEELLQVDAAGGKAAATHFQNQIASQGQAFMMKAMGLRTAVTAGNDDDIAALLAECVGLEGDAASKAAAHLKTTFGAA